MNEEKIILMAPPFSVFFNINVGIISSKNTIIIYLRWRTNLFLCTPQKMQKENSISNVDEYAGMMTEREKYWLAGVQLLQINSMDPHKDDYYFTVGVIIRFNWN